jgi:hypothetical protein
MRNDIYAGLSRGRTPRLKRAPEKNLPLAQTVAHNFSHQRLNKHQLADKGFWYGTYLQKHR